MYLIVIGWIYVVLMMSVAEATNTTGTVLGALVTFVLYGLLPVALVVYLMGTPARTRALKKREAEARAKHAAATAAPAAGTDGENSNAPDERGHAAGGAEAVAAPVAAGIAPVRKEP